MVGIKKYVIDKNVFLKLYNQGKNDAEIARKLNIPNKNCIWRFRRSLNLPSRYNHSDQKQFKFKKLKTRFIILRKMETPNQEICEELDINLSTVFIWVKKLGLPHYKSKSRNLLLEERAYGLRRLGLSDWEIADRLKIDSVTKVGILIGRALIRRCRTEPKCPFKALLPENEPKKGVIK